MPKVMMIGKVSKLKSRTRRAGSFKGSLGTVVLEGSRAQSRRYGMGNIAGSPAEHRKAEAEFLKEAADALQEARATKTCAERVNLALYVIRNASNAQVDEEWAGSSTDPRASRMLCEAMGMVRACTRPDSSGVSGARRRRRSR